MKNLWLACILTIISLQGFTQNHTQIYNSIDRLVNTYYDYHLFNGSVLVAEKGKVIYEKGLGLANRELEVENEVNTIFHLGSITKQFTAMLILQLVEKGQLDLDSKISVYLP
ncbi:MAG: serine hydrolase domain-containing protein, partial [Bacteroidota bacterium]